MTAMTAADAGLTALQQALAGLITAGDSPADALPPGTLRPDTLLRPLRGRAPLLSVYRHAWQARLADALRSNYPVLHQVLGDETFGDLAAGFMRDCPSGTPSIRWFGAGLPDWLARDTDRLPHPALLDLARMEWALGLSFDSADADPLGFDELRALAPAEWPALQLAGHPSLALLTLDWAVEPLWQQMTLHLERQGEDGGGDTPDTNAPEPLIHHLLVWRQGLETRWRSLEPAEASLLQAALEGENFERLCARADALQPGQGAALAASSLRGWVDAGLLVQLGAGAVAAPSLPDTGA